MRTGHFKVIFGIFIFILPTFQLMAQQIRSIEGEVGLGIVNSFNKMNFDRCNAGAKFFGELRYNFSDIPFDVGIHLSGSIFHRESDNAGRLKSKSYNVMAVSDYNFLRSHRVSLFAGLGIGYAQLDMTAPVKFDNTRPNYGGFETGDAVKKVCAMPRIGVEFFNHLRLTVSYIVEEKANNHLFIGIGGVIGGGQIK